MSPSPSRTLGRVLLVLGVGFLAAGMYYLYVRYAGPPPNHLGTSDDPELTEFENEIRQLTEKDQKARAAIEDMRATAERLKADPDPEKRKTAEAALALIAEGDKTRAASTAKLAQLAEKVAGIRERLDTAARNRTRRLGGLFTAVGVLLVVRGFGGIPTRKPAA